MPDYADRLLWLIKRAEMATQQAKERTLRRHGITGAQHAALTIIDQSGGITSAELARRCFVTAQTMNSTVSRLESADLVARTPHPLHRTLIEIHLTERGRRIYQEADVDMVTLDDQLAGALTPADAQALRRTLPRITALADEVERATRAP
jgi:DNA-binding MarR family transcriptional regulator